MVCAFTESAESFSLTLATLARNFMRESFGLCVKFGMAFAGAKIGWPNPSGGLWGTSKLPPELLVKGE